VSLYDIVESDYYPTAVFCTGLSRLSMDICKFFVLKLVSLVSN